MAFLCTSAESRSYENVEFLLGEGIDAYITDNFYKVEKEGKNQEVQEFCPAAFEIPFTRIQKRIGEPDLRYYVCNYCSQCVLKNESCKKVFPRYEIKEVSYLGVVMLAAIIKLNQVLGWAH